MLKRFKTVIYTFLYGDWQTVGIAGPVISIDDIVLEDCFSERRFIDGKFEYRALSKEAQEEASAQWAIR
ncbi:MAG: hypothetical protein JKY82_09785 [Rhizobiaceae bacterium]|nr:hypothetical protein [Rhizobiaceae bacterium]